MTSLTMRSVSLVLGVVLLALLAVPGIGSAAVFFVGNSAEFRDALYTAATNHEEDTIILAAGLYSTSGDRFEYIAPASENFRITIQGAGIGVTVLDGGGGDEVLGGDQVLVISTEDVTNCCAAHVVVRGLTIQNGVGPGDGGPTDDSAGLLIQASGNATIQDCAFIDNDSFGNYGAGAHVAARNARLERSVFLGNHADGYGAGLAVFATDVFVIANRFESNSANLGDGGALVSAINATVINNVFVNNHAFTEAGGLSVSVDGGTATLMHNTLTDNSADVGGGVRIRLFGASTAQIRNNIVFANNADSGVGDDIFVSDDEDGNNVGNPVALFNNVVGDAFIVCAQTLGCLALLSAGGNLDDDPLFVDAASGDIHLQNGSPAIDAGDPAAPMQPGTDFEAQPRVVGAAPDIGADESVFTVTCNGIVATIVGTVGNDVSNGTAGPDVIQGLAGNDVINGLGGNDVICGGPGNDMIDGGDGDDRLFGEQGNDLLVGGAGNDLLDGGAGNDQLLGGAGADTMRGGPGDDVLFGGPMTDVLDGGPGSDQCDGQAGPDVAVNCEVVVGVP
jgi:Ca2+-binding RTX toxin-like protein